MRSNLIQRLALCLVFVMVANGFAWGQKAPVSIPNEPPTTVERIWDIVEKSKLEYHIGLPRPVARPVKEMSCSQRVTQMRVVRSSEGHSLMAWVPAEKAKPHFEAAEKFFAERRLSEAAVEYRKGLALDPDYGPGWLYSGDVPFGRGDYPAALKAYRKALALDPTLPQAHRFAADALLKMGRLDDAETEYVRALAYDPSYEGAWSGLEYLGRLAGFAVRRPEFSPPADMLGEREGDRIPIALGEADSEWLGYILCKAVWRNEDEYRRKESRSDAKEYSWSLSEERECLITYLQSNVNLTAARLDKEAAQKGQPKGDYTEDQLIAALPAGVRAVAEVAQADLIDGFIIVAMLGKRCPVAASILPDNLHEVAEQYIRRFVIVRPSARKGEV